MVFFVDLLLVLCFGFFCWVIFVCCFSFVWLFLCFVGVIHSCFLIPPSPSQTNCYSTRLHGLGHFFCLCLYSLICLSILCLGFPSNLLLADLCLQLPGSGLCAKECLRRELKDTWRREPTIMPDIPSFINNTSNSLNDSDVCFKLLFFETLFLTAPWHSRISLIVNSASKF